MMFDNFFVLTNVLLFNIFGKMIHS